jgi:hypothetical protein
VHRQAVFVVQTILFTTKLSAQEIINAVAMIAILAYMGLIAAVM